MEQPIVITQKTVNEKYELVALIAEGTTSEVFEATLISNPGAKQVVKLLKDSNQDPVVRERFDREGQLASKLNGKYFARVHECGLDSSTGRPFIAMDFIPGLTLHQLLRHGHLSTMGAINVGIELASATQSLHEQGLLHCAINPKDIILSNVTRPDELTLSAPQIKLIDFGWAQESARVNAAPVRVLGVPEYMSPEQVLLAETLVLDERTDIYAIGLVLYEMICGRRPFKSLSQWAEMKARLSSKPATLDEGATPVIVPTELNRLVFRTLSRNPEGRYESCADLTFALKQASVSIPV